jgi:hypothetical protein
MKIMTLPNKKTSIVLYQTAASVLKQTYAGKSFPLAGKIWKTADIVTAFQAAIDAINTGNADKIAWETSVAKAKAAKATAALLYAALKGYFAVIDGRTSEAYKTLGFGPAPATASPATKVAAAEKTRATRKALGTLGKQQRKDAKRAAASAPAPAPAPVASAGGNTGGSGSNGSTGGTH